MKNKTTRSFFDEYAAKARVYASLWSGSKYAGYTKEQWTAMYLQDPHLNQLGNPFFDKYWIIFHSKAINSLSMNCCAMKHYIIYHVIGAEPEFVEKEI